MLSRTVTLLAVVGILSLLVSGSVTDVSALTSSNGAQPPVSSDASRKYKNTLEYSDVYPGTSKPEQGNIDYTFTCDDEEQTLRVGNWAFWDWRSRANWGRKQKFITRYGRWDGDYISPPYYTDPGTKKYVDEVILTDEWVSEGADRLWSDVKMTQVGGSNMTVGNKQSTNVLEWKGYSAGWENYFLLLRQCHCDPVVRAKVENKLEMKKCEMLWTPNMKGKTGGAASDTDLVAIGRLEMKDILGDTHHIQMDVSTGALVVNATGMGASAEAQIQAGSGGISGSVQVGGSVQWSTSVTLDKPKVFTVPPMTERVTKDVPLNCGEKVTLDVTNKSSWTMQFTDNGTAVGGCEVEWEYELANTAHLLWVDLVDIDEECLPCDDPTPLPTTESPIRIHTTAAGDAYEARNGSGAESSSQSEVPSGETGTLIVNVPPGEPDLYSLDIAISSSNSAIITPSITSDILTYDSVQGNWLAVGLDAGSLGQAEITVGFTGWDSQSQHLFSFEQIHLVKSVAPVLAGPDLVNVAVGGAAVATLRLGNPLALTTAAVNANVSPAGLVNVSVPEELSQGDIAVACHIFGVDSGECTLTVTLEGVEFECECELDIVVAAHGNTYFFPDHGHVDDSITPVTVVGTTDWGLAQEQITLDNGFSTDYKWHVEEFENSMAVALESQQFDLTELAHQVDLALWFSMSSEHLHDGMKVQFKTEGSGGWFDGVPVGGYPETLETTVLSGAFGGGNAGWSGTDYASGYHPAVFVIDDYLDAEEFQFRVVFATDEVYPSGFASVSGFELSTGVHDRSELPQELQTEPNGSEEPPPPPEPEES